ncbi:MAG: pyridoxamine 5'-phosphate oxidase family protein [Roseiflexaceae bacterium]
MQIDRPIVPKDYGVPTSEEGLLTWDDVRARLEQAPNYWIVTANLTAKPHAVPLWGAWVGTRFYFDGSPETRWGRNLAANPQIAIHLENGSEAVIVEGTFSWQNDLTLETFALVQASYRAKYPTYTPEHMEGLYMVTPHKIMAWTSFPKTMTRFRFS